MTFHESVNAVQAAKSARTDCHRKSLVHVIIYCNIIDYDYIKWAVGNVGWMLAESLEDMIVHL